MRDHGMPPMSTGWKLWFVVCGVLGVAFMGVIVWAIVALVQWVTSK